MDDMEALEALHMICFEIIGHVGMAKTCYVNAIAAAKEGKFDEAEALIKEGDEAYNGGHEVHMKLLQADAAGERHGEAPLILLHAEDQMAGTETTKLMALNFIDTYRELHDLKVKLG